MDPRRRVRWAVGAAAVFLLVLVVAFALLPPAYRETADQVGSVLSATGAWIALPAGLLALWALAGPAGRQPAAAEDVLDRLAGLVGRQWNREAVRRGLRGSEPMRIRWRVTERPVGVPPGEVADLGGVRVTRLRLQGEVPDLVETWRRLPYRRMVVIGRPGAGKTSAAVLLTCGLLASRRPGDPVPVLLDLAGWRPSTEDFEVWLGRTLAGRYGLRAIAREAGRLVAERGVIAVLDGFDEMRPEERAVAVTALNTLVDLPVVVMSRAEEYAATVTRTGEPLSRALIVELDPLTAQQAAGYLPGGQAGDADRWAPVARDLAGDPAGPLATALSNPLLTYLARTVYRVPSSDPAELIGFAGRDELEQRLFDRYLPALYPDRGPGRSRYPAARASAWLGFLARTLDGQGQRDFAWWRIGRAGGRPIPVARVAGVSATLAPVAVLIALVGGLTPADLGYAAAFALFGYLAAGIGDPEEPRHLRFQARAFRMAIVGGICFAVPMTFARMLLPLLGPVPLVMLTVLPAAGAVWLSRSGWRDLAASVVRWAHRREPPKVRPFPPGRWQGPALAFLAGIGFCLAFGLWEPDGEELAGFAPLFTLALAVGLGAPIGLMYGLASAFIRPAPEDELWDPDRTLRDDRAALLVPPLLMGAVAVAATVAGAVAGWWDTGASPIRHVLTAGLVVVVLGWILVIALGASAWLVYTAVRLWFAVRGRLPWRLMPFLADAARLGVLRRNGAVYQFRHDRLQSYLAGPPPGRDVPGAD